MSLSKPSYSSLMKEDPNKMEPKPSTSAEAAKQIGSPENMLSELEREKKRVQNRAAMICSGCRCGWLCCDCVLGCISCKQNRRFCYCQWTPSGLSGVLVKIPCMFCLDLVHSCTCHLKWRCKWCTVSIQKCKRGGCVTLLPSRDSPEAAPYVEIFNREDICDDNEFENGRVRLAVRNQGFPLDGSGWSIESSESSLYASSTTISSGYSAGNSFNSVRGNLTK